MNAVGQIVANLALVCEIVEHVDIDDEDDVTAPHPMTLRARHVLDCVAKVQVPGCSKTLLAELRRSFLLGQMIDGEMTVCEMEARLDERRKATRSFLMSLESKSVSSSGVGIFHFERACSIQT